MQARKLVVYTFALFFLAATFVLVVTALALLWPGTVLDFIWHLYPGRRLQLLPYGSAIGPVFLVLSLITALASLGCWLRRKWGMWLALGIFVDNGLANIYQLFSGHFTEGAIGLVVMIALVYVLLQLSARGAFR